MFERTIVFGERFYSWLSSVVGSDVGVYRGVLPAGKTPENVYVVFSASVDDFAKPFILPIRIYTKGTSSYRTALTVAQTIEEAVSSAGTLVLFPDVAFKVEKGSPFYQDLQDEDETIKAGYINLEITIY